MAEPLKAIYSEHFFTCYLLDVEKVIPTIDKSKFQALVFSNDWENKELKQRMSHIAFVLNQFLSDKYEIAIQQIIDIIQIHSTSKSNGFNFECMFSNWSVLKESFALSVQQLFANNVCFIQNT